MLKKLALPMMMVAGLACASVPASAAVRFGISIGTPVATYPAPYVQQAYPNYYAYPAPAPTIVYHRDDRDHDSHFRDRDARFRNDHGRDFRGGEGRR